MALQESGGLEEEAVVGGRGKRERAREILDKNKKKEQEVELGAEEGVGCYPERTRTGSDSRVTVHGIPWGGTIYL